MKIKIFYLLVEEAVFWCVMMAVFSKKAEAIKKIGVNNAAIISTVSPVFTLAVAFIFLNEKYSFWQLVGAAIIIIAIYWLSTKRQKKHKN